jgi:hypothetical protein
MQLIDVVKTKSGQQATFDNITDGMRVRIHHYEYEDLPAGWDDGMLEYCGEIGEIVHIAANEDTDDCVPIRIQFDFSICGENQWWFHPDQLEIV